MHPHHPTLDPFIAGLPKTETHLHLEGSIPWSLLQELDAARFSAPPPFWAPDFRYASFAEFEARIIEYAAPWFTTAERYGRAAGVVLGNCAAQNVKYVETSIHLAAVAHARGSGPEILAAIREGARRAAPGLEVRIFLGLCRDDDRRFAAQIEEALGWAGLDGLDLHGVELLPLREWTVDLWNRAREKGKFTKAHAGEFGPAAHVREAVERLGVTRIEHGVRAAEDPEVMAFLCDRGVTLDVCPISNLKLRVAPSLREHPIGTLHRAGVRCTINTDDPFFFGNTLRDEYAAVAIESGFSAQDLASLARNGFEAALLPPEKKADWIGAIDRYLAENAPQTH